VAGYSQPAMTPGPVEYKRKYKLWLLILLVIICWPAAIIYYFTRDKVPVQEFQTYAVPMQPQPGYSPSTPAAPMMAPSPGAAPICPKCGRPTTWVAQYSRWYCTNDQQYV
jgi:hypothetical protein